MSAAIELLHELADRGVVLEAVGSVLRFRPISAVTPDMLQRMKAHKCELLDALRCVVAVPAAVLAAPPRPERFRNWVRRQDVVGRWGWERPGLSTSDRWWARALFEDMPMPPGGPEAN